MVQLTPKDLDYLVARLHGRRSRLAEGERLDVLCRCHTVPDLARALYLGQTIDKAAPLQRRLIEDLASEIAGISTDLQEPHARLLSWVLTRFTVKNLKVLLRGLLTGASPEAVRQHLLAVPPDPSLDIAAVAAAESLGQFIELLPTGPLRVALQEAEAAYGGQSRPFFFEAALDRGYYRELLARVDDLPGEDRDTVAPLARQEVDAFHLMLVARGRFVHVLPPESLLPLHVAGTAIGPKRFSRMLNDHDLGVAAGRAARRALDVVPPSVTPDPVLLDSLACQRLLRLAQQAFRSSHMGFGAVAGYVVIRHMEVANLITLSEGIRAGLPAEAIRSHLITSGRGKADHV